VYNKALAEHLVGCGDACSRASSILELGAGTGLAGLTAAMLSRDASRVVLTDNNRYVLELLRRNIDANFAHTPRESVGPLRVGARETVIVNSNNNNNNQCKCSASMLSCYMTACQPLTAWTDRSLPNFVYVNF